MKQFPQELIAILLDFMSCECINLPVMVMLFSDCFLRCNCHKNYPDCGCAVFRPPCKRMAWVKIKKEGCWLDMEMTMADWFNKEGYWWDTETTLLDLKW